MPIETYALAATSRRTIEAWHRALPVGDADALGALIAENVVFHSPAVQSPIPGREASVLVLTAVASVLANMRYRRTFVAGPCDAALEFSAEIGKLKLTGVDVMRFAPDGMVVEFEVMIRPMGALAAIAEAIGSRVAPRLLQLKLKRDPA
jgi:hypothetical protein